MTLLFIADVLIVGSCWILAYYIRFHIFPFPEPTSIPEFRIYLRACFVVMLLAAICLIYGKMYTPKRIASYRAEMRSIFSSTVVLWVLLIGITFYYRKHSFSRLHSGYFLCFGIFFLSGFRFGVRTVLWYLRSRGRNLRRVLIVGSGKTAVNLQRKFLQNRTMGFLVTGYVNNGKYGEKLASDRLGDYADIPRAIARYRIDQVYIALDSNQQSDLQEINSFLAEQMVDIHIVPDIYHTLNINPEIVDLDGLPVISVRQSSVGGWNAVLKRAFDIVVASCCIVAVFPLWLILPILIKLTSPGPVLYGQDRMGLDGKRFTMFKFRSMRVDAEEKTGAVWATKKDDRRTGLGAFLRKISLDEIPQLFNVLGGSMSMVGPRPERPVFIREFKRQIPNYMLRHKMKAGITGWAQINGWRGNTSLEKRIEYDIYYLTHWSLWFDIKIFLISFFKAFINPNAY